MTVATDSSKTGRPGGGFGSVAAGSVVSARYNSSAPSPTSGSAVELQANSLGALKVELAMNNLGNSLSVGTTTTDAISSISGSARALDVRATNYVLNGSTFDRDSKATTTYRLPSSAASTNAALIRNGATSVHSFVGYNTSGALIYSKLFNKGSAAPIPGTDTPELNLPIPPNGGLSKEWPKTRYFPLGLGICLTTGSADLDTGAVAAGAIVGLNISYHQG